MEEKQRGLRFGSVEFSGYGDGMEPCSTTRSRLTVGSGVGMAENSALV